MNQSQNKVSKNLLIIFNIIGGTFVFFGITYFICLNWSQLNSFLKISTTLGSGIIAYLIGCFLSANKKYRVASNTFFILSSLLLPSGMLITNNIYQWITNQNILHVIITATIFIIFLTHYILSPRTIFLLLSIIFASFLYFNLMDLILNQSLYIYNNMYPYEVMTLGFAYLLLGRHLDLDKKNMLTGQLYFFGGLFVLLSSFCLGSYLMDVELNSWKIITAALIILFFYLSIPFKSKSLLSLAAVFLIIYIIDMSLKFADLLGKIGWPLTLISLGLFLIVIGYVFRYLHQLITKK